MDRYRISDTTDLYKARRDSWRELSPWLDWADEDDAEMSVDECEQYIRSHMELFDARTALELMITERLSGRFVGQIGLYNIDWSIVQAQLVSMIDRN